MGKERQDDNLPSYCRPISIISLAGMLPVGS